MYKQTLFCTYADTVRLTPEAVPKSLKPLPHALLKEPTYVALPLQFMIICMYECLCLYFVHNISGCVTHRLPRDA
jgi:hypothetical protein